MCKMKQESLKLLEVVVSGLILRISFLNAKIE